MVAESPDHPTRKVIPTVRGWALILFLPILFVSVFVGDRLIAHPNRQYLLLVFLVAYFAVFFGLEKLVARK